MQGRCKVIAFDSDNVPVSFGSQKVVTCPAVQRRIVILGNDTSLMQVSHVTIKHLYMRKLDHSESICIFA